MITSPCLVRTAFKNNLIIDLSHHHCLPLFHVRLIESQHQIDGTRFNVVEEDMVFTHFRSGPSDLKCD
jgi:hypothetical protein